MFNALGARVEPINDGTRLGQSKNLLTERLSQKKYAADAAVLEALEYFSSSKEHVNSTLWMSCALFYNPAWLHLDPNRSSAESNRDELWSKYPFFRNAEGDNSRGFGAEYSDRAVLMAQVFNESTDPFVKVQFASFFFIWFSRDDVPLNRKLSESVKSGLFTQEALDDFLATSALVRNHAIFLDPHHYGELGPLFLEQISESPIQIPWLRKYLQDHPLPASIIGTPKALPPASAPSAAEAPPAKGWSTASLRWLGLAIALLVGTLLWLRRVKREQRDHADSDSHPP